MDYSLTGLVAWAGASLAALLVAVAFTGGVVNSHPSYLVMARICVRLAVLALAVYPVLWARGPRESPDVIVVAMLACGAFLGGAYYAIGLWYRLETDRQQAPNEKP